MKIKAAIIIGSTFLILSGCVPSLYPLYTDDVLAFREELVGSFREDGTPHQWVFINEDDENYLLNHLEKSNNSTDDGRSGLFSQLETHLVKLEDTYYLDFFPSDNSHLKISNFLSFHLIAVHTFARVEFIGDTVNIYQLDFDWLETMIEEKKINIRFEETKDQLLLTAKPKELQQFFIKYGNEKEAFTGPTVLVREAG